MEIISYNDAGYTSGSPDFKLFLKSLFANKRVNFQGERILRRRNFSAKSVSVSIKKAFLTSVDFVRKGFKYFWLLPSLVIVALIPQTVSSVMNRIERNSRAVPVSFENPETELSSVEELMNDFAREQYVAFDESGNLLSSDGIVLPVVQLKEAVTFQNYTVKSGDTISGITKKFGLSNISTLIAVNNIDNVRGLRSGQKLIVPSMDGLYHTVQGGESIASIASKYNCSTADLLDVNDLSTDVIAAGTKLFIPGAKMDSSSLKKAMGELFVCPIKVKYRLSSRFGKRADPFTGVASNHTGIDLACASGTQIYSALSGTVSYTGYSSVYGYYVIVNHYDGYQTLYAHMSKILAKKGQAVSQNTVLGLVGSTGYSTGPHLHFTVYKNGKLVDPLTLIKN